MREGEGEGERSYLYLFFLFSSTTSSPAMSGGDASPSISPVALSSYNDGDIQPPGDSAGDGEGSSVRQETAPSGKEEEEEEEGYESVSNIVLSVQCVVLLLLLFTLCYHSNTLKH